MSGSTKPLSERIEAQDGLVALAPARGVQRQPRLGRVRPDRIRAPPDAGPPMPPDEGDPEPPAGDGSVEGPPIIDAAEQEARLARAREVVLEMVKAYQAAPTMVDQLDMGLDEHDRLIAYVLGLSHALNIAFFTALAESGEAAPQLARLSSTTFEAQLLVSDAVAHDNPRMYFEIQNLNKFGLDPLDALYESVARIREVVAGGDEEAFVALMQNGRRYLASRA